MVDSMTQLRAAGPAGTKRNLVVFGDGFAPADQAAYNNWVQTQLIDGVFGRDYFREDASAWNIFRVNLESVDSGISTRVYDEKGTSDGSDDTITSTTMLNTALGMIFSGSWSHCWMEYGPNTEARIQAALAAWVPESQLILIVLNTPGFGGCGGGGRSHVTLGVGWDVIAHEFGHGLGGLADEYCVSGAYVPGGPEPINLTTDTNRASTKWGRFIAPTTPVPTGVGNCADYNQGAKPATWDDNRDVGIFEGGWTRLTGIFRPVVNCRMRGNAPPFCPVCYTAFKQQYHTWTGHHFRNCYAGDFNGDGRSDVLVHAGNSIQIFRSNGTQLDHVSSAVERVPGSWQFQPSDQFYVGDFNGDGKDEVVVFNGSAWVMPYLGLLADDGNNGLRLIARYDGDIPGWGGLAAHDRFYVGDFSGDGRKDLFVFNGEDWAIAYVGMLRSTGAGFELVRRFDGDIQGWGGLARHDELFVGDYSGNGRSDLYIFNGSDWSMSYVGMFRSTGTDLDMSTRFDGDIPGWGGLAPHDRLIVGDFDGDGKADLFIFNGDDWSMAYLGMFRSTGTSLQMVERYDGDVPGWGGMRRHDKFLAADITGDGKTDLWAWNYVDWSEEYLGRMISIRSGLRASYTGDWVGEWNLGGIDKFEVCNYQGLSGQPNLFVHNQEWFGMMQGRSGLTLQRLYYRWIHNYRHGRNW